MQPRPEWQLALLRPPWWVYVASLLLCILVKVGFRFTNPGTVLVLILVYATLSLLSYQRAYVAPGVRRDLYEAFLEEKRAQVKRMQSLADKTRDPEFQRRFKALCANGQSMLDFFAGNTKSYAVHVGSVMVVLQRAEELMEKTNTLLQGIQTRGTAASLKRAAVTLTELETAFGIVREKLPTREIADLQQILDATELSLVGQGLTSRQQEEETDQ